MLYLNDEHVIGLNADWNELCSTIEEAVGCIARNDYAQPVKPYLRYRNLVNRIIAMPAFAGGNINSAGIKWIASFPGNIEKGIRRANSVTILNEGDTGIPYCIFNTPVVSGLRTAAVTGLVMRKWLEKQKQDRTYTVGMTGFGPIGKLHMDMAFTLLGDKLREFRIYDLRPVDINTIPEQYRSRVKISGSWEEAFDGADIFMTCTVSKAPYIDRAPVKGSLQLNVSLRDYKDSWMSFADVILVDDWEEVNREKTDIEMMHLNQGLKKEGVFEIASLLEADFFSRFGPEAVYMFNPMGMAVFDIATAHFLYKMAKERKAGVEL